MLAGPQREVLLCDSVPLCSSTARLGLAQSTSTTNLIATLNWGPQTLSLAKYVLRYLLPNIYLSLS